MIKPDTFMVFDAAGRVWPPGFRSQLCDPHHPNSVLRSVKQQQAQVVNRANRERIMESGEGWGNGYLGRLSNAISKIDIDSTHTRRV